MAEWMAAHGARASVEVLPPLFDVPETPGPPPSGPPELLYCGWVYSANAAPLKWIERAAPGASLRLLTGSTPADLVRLGLDARRWQIDHAANAADVARAVRRATWCVIALDPCAPNREALKVAWPTKLREYLAFGRPVLCIAAADYAAAELAAGEGWGIVAVDEASTRAAVQRALTETADALAARSARAHAFARAAFDNGTIGARFRHDLMS
jgi:hypothetical protein